VEPAEIDEQHVLERLLPVQPVPGVDGELGLADPDHPLDSGDHHRVPVARGAAQPVQFGDPAGERLQLLRQRVVDPHLGHRLGFPADHAQGLPPLGHVPHIRVQRLDHRDDQVGVETPPAGLEAVRHRRSTRQFTRRAAGRGPGRVDPLLDRLVGGVAGPDFQQS
jgi:hypothetical protein